MDITDIKRLVVFGDSNTFGHGLPDTENLTRPSELAWPSVIARFLINKIKEL